MDHARAPHNGAISSIASLLRASTTPTKHNRIYIPLGTPGTAYLPGLLAAASNTSTATGRNTFGSRSPGAAPFACVSRNTTSL